MKLGEDVIMWMLSQNSHKPLEWPADGTI